MSKMNVRELLTKLEKVALSKEETIPHVSNLMQSNIRHVLKSFRLRLSLNLNADVDSICYWFASRRGALFFFFDNLSLLLFLLAYLILHQRAENLK
jgi:hypothetical protein